MFFSHGNFALFHFINCSVEMMAVTSWESVYSLSNISQLRGTVLKNLALHFTMLDMTAVRVQQVVRHILYVTMGTAVPSLGKTENQRFS